MLFGKKKAKQKEAEEAEKKAKEEKEAEAKEQTPAKPAPVPAAVFSSRIAGVFGRMYRLVLSASLRANIVQIESGDRIIFGKEVPLRLYFDDMMNFIGSHVIIDQKQTFIDDFARDKLYSKLCSAGKSFTAYYCLVDKEQTETSAAQDGASSDVAEAFPAAGGSVLDESENDIRFICVEVRAEMIPGPSGENTDRCIIFVRFLDKLPEDAVYRKDIQVDEDEPSEIDWENERIELFAGRNPIYVEYNSKEDLLYLHNSAGETKSFKNYIKSIESRSDFTVFHSDIQKLKKCIEKAVAGQSNEEYIRYRESRSSANKFRVHSLKLRPVGKEFPAEWVVAVLNDVDEEYRANNNRNAIAEEIEKTMTGSDMAIYEIDTAKDLIYKIVRDEIGFTRSGAGISFTAYVKQRVSGDIVDAASRPAYEKWIVPDYLEKQTAHSSYEFESMLKLPGSLEYRCYRETISKLNGVNHYLRIRRDVNDQYNSRRSEFQVEELSRYVAYNQSMLDTMASLVEFRNVEAGPHIHKVRQLTKMLLEDVAVRSPMYDITKERINLYVEAATTHDIGKIVIPDHILNKPGALTKEEYEIMKTHTSAGAKIVEKLTLPGQDELLKVCKDVALHHHERYDGSGYPEGLVGDENSIGVQCVGLADVFDAMLSQRCYKDAFSLDETTNDFLVKNSRLWNPRVLESFRACLDRMAALYIEKDK